MGISRAFSKAARNVLAQLVRTLKPPRKGLPKEWCHRLEQMKKCQTPEQLVRQFGEPAHKVRTGEMDIWHYPLGFAGGFLYSIHAVTTRNDLSQLYMHMEPAPKDRATPRVKR
jgi:hypothetical protein